MARRTAVIGLQEFDKTIQGLMELAEPKEQRKALRAAGEVIAEEARNLVPVNSGNLRESIVVRDADRRQQRRYGAAVLVGPRGGRDGAPHAHLVEFGTAPHRITARRGGRLWGIFARSVYHPGAQAQPYMRPAYDTRLGDAVREAAAILRAQIAQRTGRF